MKDALKVLISYFTYYFKRRCSSLRALSSLCFANCLSFFAELCQNYVARFSKDRFYWRGSHCHHPSIFFSCWWSISSCLLSTLAKTSRFLFLKANGCWKFLFCDRCSFYRSRCFKSRSCQSSLVSSWLHFHETTEWAFNL